MLLLPLTRKKEASQQEFIKHNQMLEISQFYQVESFLLDAALGGHKQNDLMTYQSRVWKLDKEIQYLKLCEAEI